MKPNKKQKREFALLDELQNNHGYTLREVPRGNQIVMMLAPAAKTIEPMRICHLIVPMDSALAVSLKELDEKTKAPKAKTAPRRRGK